MTLNFDKHRDHLEQDIREELQSIYIDKFKILDIKENILGPYCPIFLFEIKLEDYRDRLDILVDGSDLILKWGEEKYAIQYKYDRESLKEGLERIKLYLDQPELIFSEPLSPKNVHLKSKGIERMIANVFEGKTRTNCWEKSDQKDGDYKALITNLLPHYQASFTLELAEQHFIVKDIFPIKAGIESQGFQIHQPIDLTSSNMASFLSQFKEFIEAELEGGDNVTDSMSVSELVLSAPLKPDTVGAKVLQVQRIISTSFTKDVSFFETTKMMEDGSLYEVDFFAKFNFYSAIFSITLIGRHFYLHVTRPNKADLKDYWDLFGYPYELTEENLKKVIKVAETYFASHLKKEQKPSGSNKSKSQLIHKIKTQARKKNEALAKEKADKEVYLGLRKLWKLQFLIFFILIIMAFVIEVYMTGAGYKAFKMRIQFSRVSVHSFSLLFITVYGFLTLYITGLKINGFLKQYPRWKGLPTKESRLPKKETGLTFLVLFIVLFLGAIELTLRKPEPKVEIPKIDQNLNKAFEQERSSSYSDLIKGLRDSSSQNGESETSATE
ncbi:hypothetical protein O3640_04780 [Streptococcus sp. 27098_8_75]|jgi:hypothetical protein|uniref:hypothetical protein n=1 Tax=Streptococcus TaxID=1301 RepID=UPI000F68B391|nr:hypothetical protein [Streptococcus gordonii]MCB6584739.1 hypothetical protein [Streptococcus gordonii]MCB7053673.1 hypothetical protein [Streptococcus gordonii]MCB7055759.1 hypothetical protein [Streptococcus gordonii]MCC3174587.1 hypothetical protein [Streptococcus gordonii]MCG4842765.1 hypothetical protein [Streptococcus gordonii]